MFLFIFEECDQWIGTIWREVMNEIIKQRNFHMIYTNIFFSLISIWGKVAKSNFLILSYYSRASFYKLSHGKIACTFRIILLKIKRHIL